MNKIVKLVVTFFGVGYLPKAPGTWGSLATLPVAYLISLNFGRLGLLTFVVAVTVLGIWASNAYVRSTGKKDPSEVVIDEVAGQSLALCLVPLDWRLYVLAFVLFRLFDISKPPPVSTLERLKDGWGIMLDDLMAGVYATVCFIALIYMMPI